MFEINILYHRINIFQVAMNFVFFHKTELMLLYFPCVGLQRQANLKSARAHEKT